MSTIDHLSVLETALAISPRLSELPDPQIKTQLDQLLQQLQTDDSNEEDIADQIWDLLTSTKTTQTWITQVQQEIAGSTAKGFEILPGYSSAIAAPIFKCPQCDYIWSRDRVGRPTPFCPTHQVLLEQVA